MQRLCFCFPDMVSGEPVYLWRCQNGTLWLAAHAWSLFRMRTLHGPELWQDHPPVSSC